MQCYDLRKLCYNCAEFKKRNVLTFAIFWRKLPSSTNVHVFAWENINYSLNNLSKNQSCHVCVCVNDIDNMTVHSHLKLICIHNFLFLPECNHVYCCEASKLYTWIFFSLIQWMHVRNWICKWRKIDYYRRGKASWCKGNWNSKSSLFPFKIVWKVKSWLCWHFCWYDNFGREGIFF